MRRVGVQRRGGLRQGYAGDDPVVQQIAERTGEAIRTARRRRAMAELNLAGLAVHGPKNAVDMVLKGASLHR